MVRVETTALDTRQAYSMIDRGGAGSVVFHYAVVKENNTPDRTTVGIEYAAAGDVAAELTAIEAELREKYDLTDAVLIRRLGVVGIGEIISLIAAASPASEQAFEACRHGIERMKKMTSIRKDERYS